MYNISLLLLWWLEHLNHIQQSLRSSFSQFALHQRLYRLQTDFSATQKEQGNTQTSGYTQEITHSVNRLLWDTQERTHTGRHNLNAQHIGLSKHTAENHYALNAEPRSEHTLNKNLIIWLRMRDIFTEKKKVLDRLDYWWLWLLQQAAKEIPRQLLWYNQGNWFGITVYPTKTTQTKFSLY